MAKIKINCGYCSKSKGCEIKKDFKKLSSEYKDFDEIKNEPGSILSYTRYYEFELKCPFKERKYKSGDEVYFTFGVGRYIKKREWECIFDCDGCHKDCKDGIITFENIRYKKYITIKGKIVNPYRYDSYIISVDKKNFDIVKCDFNEKDIELIDKITSSIDLKYDEYIAIISKEKYIKHLNNG